MMREIKFRAWHKSNKTMWGVFKLGIYSAYSILSDGKISSHFEAYNDEFELMQFTGLKDKTGKEIYEGDKLVWNKKRGVNVIFLNGCWKAGGFCLADFNKQKLEVIGNIYEEKELLK